MLYVILLTIVGSACLLLPLIGAALSAKKGCWIVALLFILLFVIMRRVLFIVENRINVRSPSNPDSRCQGSGLTIVAPWLRRRQKRIAPKSKDATNKEAQRETSGHSRNESSNDK